MNNLFTAFEGNSVYTHSTAVKIALRLIDFECILFAESFSLT